MANKPDIQYISQFYTPGSEAQVLEFKPVKKKKKAKTKLPKVAPEQKLRIRVDYASLCGLAVAAVMLVLMLVGTIQYLGICAKHREMTDNVIKLQNENIALRQELEAGYDLEAIEITAQSLGMVPQENVKTVTMTVEVPAEEAEPTWWENVCWFWNELWS